MKSIKFYFVFCLTFNLGATIVAQTISSELYQYNYSILNPAFTSIDDQNVSFLLRTATYNYSSGLVHQTDALLSFTTKLDKINSGFGFMGSSSGRGASITNLNINYSYNIKISNNSNLILGTRISNNRSNIDLDLYGPIDPNDPVLDPDKDRLFISNISASFGVIFKIKNFIGAISADGILGKDKFDYPAKATPDIVNIILSYPFKLSDWGKLTQSIFSPLVGYEINRIDLNSVLLINRKLLTGLTLEISDGQFIPKINFGYRLKDSFEITTMIYSRRRDFISNEKFTGSLSARFFFKD